MDLTRRELSRIIAGLFATTATGCGAPGEPNLPISGSVIDVHCHLFNGMDLSITRFLTEVIIPNNEPKLRAAAPAGIQDPTLEETILSWVKEKLLHGTPTAQDELAMLDGTTAPRLAASGTAMGAPMGAPAERQPLGTEAQAEARVVARVARYLRETAPTGTVTMAARPPGVRQAILRAASEPPAPTARTAPLAAVLAAVPAAPGLAAAGDENDATALRAVRSDTVLGALFRWIGLFMRYRHELADAHALTLRQNGKEPVLLVPLMVDYAHWLGEEPNAGSNFPDQAAVFGRIARRPEGPAVHGMFAYDPLRKVFWNRGASYDAFKLPAFEPIGAARVALEDHGFLGLKLYPPMGFKPIGNTDNQSYQDRIGRRLGGTRGLGLELDAAMACAIDFCVDEEAPMLAHATYSIGAGKGYAKRAEPRYWIDVLENSRKPRWRGLRLCLAHQGGFNNPESAPPASAPPHQRTWEWTIGRYVQAHPDSNLYMDISYLSEILSTKPADRQRAAAGLRDWIATCDPQARHILFGTDWTMTGRETTWPGYTARVVEFLTKDCGLDPARVDRIMAGNAIRYLGLRDGDRTRKRLLAFYDRHGLPHTRLPGGAVA